MNDLIERVGGLVFRNGILVSDFDAEKEIEKRGGIDKMFGESLKANALLVRLAKSKSK